MKKAEFPAFIAAAEREILAPEARFYIWGAGVAGEHLYKHLSGEPLRILGFLDSNPEKRTTSFCGLPVIAPEAVEWIAGTKVILASLDYPDGMEKYLKELGKQENKDYFFSNTFLTIYMMSRHNKMYLHHVNVAITDNCTLQCKDCSFCIPYYKERNSYPLDKILAGLDTLFGIVDYVQELHLIGGEPLLYRQLPQLVEQIGCRYRHQIGEFAIATNGSLVPGDELCEVCRQYDVFFTISDYRSSPVFLGTSQVDTLVRILEQAKVSYRIGNKSVWLDFCGTVPQGGYPEEILPDRFRMCFFRNRGLYLDRMYYCQHQYGVFRAGKEADDPDGWLGLAEQTKESIFKFEMGFLPKGYLSHCARCSGFERLNTNWIDGAAQCKNGDI